MTVTALRSLDWRNAGLRKLNVRSLGLALVMAAALLSPLGSGRAQAEEIKVSLDNFTFSPNEVKVKVGDIVTWTNHDDIPHTIVSAGKFRSKTLDTDNSFSFTFTAAGDYAYVCGLHPFMHGKVTVTP